MAMDILSPLRALVQRQAIGYAAPFLTAEGTVAR
jgi:hypothetical protein